MSLDAADKIKIKTLLWRDYVSGIYLDTIRDINSAKSPRKSSKSSDSKSFQHFWKSETGIVSVSFVSDYFTCFGITRKQPQNFSHEIHFWD